MANDSLNHSPNAHCKEYMAKAFWLFDIINVIMMPKKRTMIV